MQKLVVLSADYPGSDYLYGDVFVHTRLKEYVKFCKVEVVGFNPHLTHVRDYTYEGINAFITYDLESFKQKIVSSEPDVIVGHLIRCEYFTFLLSLNKPIVVFLHGYEALSWRRRLFNYNAISSFKYFAIYAWNNIVQLKALRKFVVTANARIDVKFVFVSNWLKSAAEKDIGVTVKHGHIVPNPINTDLFSYSKKTDNLRKNILLIRSFKARNYANDISVEAILRLSHKQFFKDLTFTLYGEGYLFNSLTAPLKQFENVHLNNCFIEHKDIPAVHAQNGIFLCPSRMDTQGVSMCEAMASGLVPITSNIGGIPEFVEDNLSGFLTEGPDEIAEKITFLYHNPEKFQHMSQAARNAIVLRCPLKKIIQKELEIINSINGLSVNQSILSYQQCTKCILDTNDDPDITFDDAGVCSYCKSYDAIERKVVKTGEQGRKELSETIHKIKISGKGKKYDCIVGLSGGVDSTYLAYQASLHGLKVLAVHFDNGWNSELAVSNIENVIRKLNFDLITYVIDWEEFKNLQLAFLKASVVDIEMITDHAIIATMYRLALKHGIKYILSGTNVVTEAVLPANWIHFKGDHVHIRAINKIYGKKDLVKFPLLTTSLKVRSALHRIKSISLLNLMPYNKADVKEIITEKLGWKDYGGKHYESIFTRFYQGYILPTKFGIDKRKAHLSNLICSGQITRDEALAEITKPAYDEATRRIDYEFVLKKLNLSREEFETIMKTPAKSHRDYPIEGIIYDRLKFLRPIRPVWRLFKRLIGI